MLAIVGGKGGCGKTTTALGIARAFGRTGQRTLAVDADCDMPNLHVVADTPATPGLRALANGDSIARVTHESRAVPRLGILPAGSQTGTIPREALRRVRRYRARVVLDCPAGAGTGVTEPAAAADRAIVVSTPDTQSQLDGVKTAEMLASLDTRLLGAVITRVDEPRAIPDGPLTEDYPVLGSIPEVDGAILGDGVGRLTYERLAKKVRKRNV
jgi:septum site-determining protein MinD